MNHQRKAIRKRIVEILTSAAGSLGVPAGNIFSNRMQEIVAQTHMPCIVVNTKKERVLRMPVNASFREYELQLPIQIDCFVTATGHIEDAVDDFMDDVLTELLKHDMDQLNDTEPLWGDLIYESGDLELHEQAEKSLGMGTLTINIIYQAETATETPEDYEGSDIDYQVKATLSNAAEGQLIMSDVYDTPPQE